ncbi:MAG: ATP-binding protein [Spirochaetaceae bacterium]|nr:ATP-binding protein [Spirochaetaceae bacterium]
MLLQFKCKNHRSIKDEITFSMRASADTTHSSSLISFNENKYLRCAEIYGANGSGKTSVLDALAKMSLIILNSNNHQPGDYIIRAPHKLSEKSEPTEFSIIFEKNNRKYSYAFSYNEQGILDEYLYYWPSQKKAKIFSRSYDKFDFTDSFSKQGENCNGRLKTNQLLLSLAAKETNIKEIAEAFLFFRNDLIVYPGEPNNWFEYSVEKLQNDETVKQSFLNFMKKIGSDIVDVKAKIEKRQLTEKEIPPVLPQFVRSQILMQPANFIDLKLIYEKFSLDINEESEGIQKLFRFLCPLIDILYSGKIFICDEIETHLHPTIVYEIINTFIQNRETNGQIIFTTHDTDLLDLDFIRRDQIWFTELKPENRSTDLYSLAELKNVRKDENIKKGYISGKYGAIPILNNKLKIFLKELESNG